MMGVHVENERSTRCCIEAIPVDTPQKVLLFISLDYRAYGQTAWQPSAAILIGDGPGDRALQRVLNIVSCF